MATPKSPSKRKGAPKTTAASAPKRKAMAKSDHPQYDVMIKEAIADLKERKGSSRQAILKYLMANFDLGDDVKIVNNHLKKALVRMTEADVLRRPKGIGSTGSFRLASKESKKGKKKEDAGAQPVEVEAASRPLKSKKVPKVKAASKEETGPSSEGKRKIGRVAPKKRVSGTAEKTKKAGVAKKVAVEKPSRKNTGRKSKKVVAKPKKN